MIRPVGKEDVGAVCRIQNHYIENSIFTFEEEAISAGMMGDRIEEVTASLPWLVCEDEGGLVGYAFASRWKGRCAYRYSVECSIYLAPEATGRGFGSRLYGELIAILRERGFHTVIAGIALPNPASVALHEKVGFRKVAHFEEVGWKFDRWIDVGYWELILCMR